MTSVADPLVTIVVATFNSGAVLPRTLDAVAAQSYPSVAMELLIVDGGSTDDTHAVAERYGARIVPNPRTEPVYAKFLAIHEARGSLILYLDHDEVMLSKDSIRGKVNAMRAADVHAVSGSGYANPAGCAPVNDYINEFGDPFSSFVYRLSKHHRFFLPTMRRRYATATRADDHDVFQFSATDELPILELCAGGSLIDLDYLRRELPAALETPANIPHLFYLMLPASPRIALMTDDVLAHHSADTFGAFLRKIRWRVKNNVHFPAMANSGFTGRQAFGASKTRWRPLLFLPYSFSILLPLWSGARLAVTRRNPIYLAHAYLCLYTASLIVFHMTLRTFGYRPQLRSYDETTVVGEGHED